MAASAWSVFFKGSARTWVSPSSTVILGSEKTVGILWDWPMGFGDENQVRKNLRGKSSQTSMTSQMHQMGIEKSHTSQNFPEAKKTKVEIVFKHRKTQTSALKRITKKRTDFQWVWPVVEIWYPQNEMIHTRNCYFDPYPNDAPWQAKALQLG